MKPILYESSETTFTSNGLGRLADCISCTVTEERNGIYECQFDYPITGGMFDQITEGRIIGVIHDDKKDIQPFDIYARTAPINGVVTFYAHHISYRLGNVILKPMTASTCVAAMAAIPQNTYNSCPFTFWTDKSVTATWSVSVPSAVKAVLGGQEGSILDVYGTGEYEWDKFAVKLHLNRGADNGVTIRYGVNLTDLTQDVDVSGVYTAVVPYWLGTDGTLVTLPEGYIAQSGMAVIPVPLDLSQEWQDAPTVEQLRAKAASRLSSSNAWLPNENIKISFIDLSHTEEYKDVAALQRVSLCDKVSVYYGDLDVAAVSVKVVRTVYNVLTEMYDEIELGDPKTTLADTIASKFADAIADLPTNMQVRSMTDAAVDNATAQITGALGGFVRFMYDANGKMTEILIMDTDSVETATNVWRWNSGGLGFSSNGYDGPYGTAITQDGSIVADYITSGTMDANLIRTGIITSPVGGSYWDLDTGVLMISGVSASEIADNIGQSVTGLDIEYAQSQSSSIAPTTGWSTVAPSWAAGWYIWQRVKTTTPDGIEYSEPTCISGRDGAGVTDGLNQATLYLYQRNGTQPLAPSVSMTYTFADGSLTNIPTGWSRSIPSGTAPCWVTSAAAISSDTAITLAANAWQEPVMLAQSGAAVSGVVTYFALSDSIIPPATDQFNPLGTPVPWTDDENNVMTDDLGETIYFDVDEAPVPTADDPYVWSFQRSTYTDGTVLDSTKYISAIYGEQGVGVAQITEQYYLSTSDEEPTGGTWSDRQPVWVEGHYIWTRSRIQWTDDTVTTTDPVLARALNSANEKAAEAASKADSAAAREQTIYRSAPSGTITMAGTTTWVGESGNTQDVWTTTRPVYASAYPVLFVALQRQTVEQRAAGSTCSCTTPAIDQTTTVIDGGHISTGTIDAGVVNVTNIKAENITSGYLSADLIEGGSITAGKIASGAISTDKLAANAVTTAKLAADAVTADKIAANAVTSTAIQASAISTDKLAANAVTAAKIASGEISIDKLSTSARSSLVSSTVSIYWRATAHTTPSINTSMSIGTSVDTDNAWTYLMPRPKRGCYFYTCERYVKSDNSVTFSSVREIANASYSSLWCSSSDATYIDGGRIYARSITADQIHGNTVTVDKLAGSISNSGWELNLTDGTFTIGNIAAENITSGFINSARINTGTITLNQLATGVQNSIAYGEEAYDRDTVWRATNSTSGQLADKVVSCDGFILKTGAVIEVYNNNAEVEGRQLTLNVNGTGAKTIYVNNAVTSASNQLLWSVKTMITYVYDGTYWCVNDSPKIYRASTCTVNASTAEKVVGVNSGVIFKGAVIYVPFTNDNTSTTAKLTLLGNAARNIYYGTGTTAPTTANGRGWLAGRTAIFEFDGQYWRIQDNATIIDGGHILTGTIDASSVDVTNIDADNITTGTISGGSGKSIWNLDTGLFRTDGVNADDYGQRVTINNGVMTFAQKARSSSSYTSRGTVGIPENKGFMVYDDRSASSTPSVTIAAGPNANTLQMTGYSAVRVEYAGNTSASSKIVLKSNAIEIIKSNESVGVTAYTGSFVVLTGLLKDDGVVTGATFKTVGVINGLICSVE